MNKLRWFRMPDPRLWGAAALLTMGCMTAHAQPAPEEIDAQANEVRIMSRVLNESLAPVLRGDEGGPHPEPAGPQPPHGPRVQPPPQLNEEDESLFDGPVKRSPFEVRRPPVDGQYIPTVGAIFEVRVNFPLSEPPMAVDDKAAETKSVDSNDLWQKNSQSHPRPGDMVLAIEAGEMEFFRGPDGARREPPKYDPQRVEELRKTLIDTVARYAHRMESLDDNERIVLLVSSGRPPAVIRQKIENAKRVGEGPARKLIVQNAMVRGGGGSDQIVLSFRKGDLKEERQANQVEDKMIERRVRGAVPGGPFVDPLAPPRR